MNGVSGSGSRYFDDEELKALQRDPSTSEIANKGRRDAGSKEKADVTVRGDDKTLNERLEANQTHVSKGEAAAGVLHAVEIAESIGVGAHAMHALGRAPLVAIPLATWALAQYGMHEMEKKKLETKDAATKDQMHAALVTTLELPGGYRAAELERLDVDGSNLGPSKKIGDQFKTGMPDHALAAVLQLHCDQGSSAAERMVQSGGAKGAFFAANPEAKRRYEVDAAFHAGFDAIVWAKNDSPASYKAALDNVHARDARYEAAHVSYRM
ncbi:MAG TPA: hypothetical protein VLT33_17040 [Labilithrix sp.]|nr:hypothetical protein [Labilithrix sp.]